MNLRTQVELHCGGPGSGRHPEYGQFRPSISEGGRFASYRGNQARVTFRQDGKGGATVSEGNFMEKQNPVFKGLEGQARQFMEDRYGIGKWGQVGMPDAPNQPYRAAAAGGQTDSSSFIGRKYTVQDNQNGGYGHPIGEYDNPEEAERAMLARPYSKISSRPLPAYTPQVRDMARQRLVKTNPDVD